MFRIQSQSHKQSKLISQSFHCTTNISETYREIDQSNSFQMLEQNFEFFV
jgi:hypothetical protein